MGVINIPDIFEDKLRLCFLLIYVLGEVAARGSMGSSAGQWNQQPSPQTKGEPLGGWDDERNNPRRGFPPSNDPVWKIEDSIPGVPGQSYPNHDKVPRTSFDCSMQVFPGYYADIEAQCQVFHICQADGRQNSFLCPLGTIFNQETFVCDWWFNVNCGDSAQYATRNAHLYKSPHLGIDGQKVPSYNQEQRGNRAPGSFDTARGRNDPPSSGGFPSTDSWNRGGNRRTRAQEPRADVNAKGDDRNMNQPPSFENGRQPNPNRRPSQMSQKGTSDGSNFPGGNADNMAGGPVFQGGNPNRMAGGPNFQGGNPNRMTGGSNFQGGDPNRMAGGPNLKGGNPNRMAGGSNFQGGNPNRMAGGPNLKGGNPNRMAGGSNFQGGNPNRMAGGKHFQGGNPNRMAGGPNSPGVNPKRMAGGPNFLRGNLNSMESGPNFPTANMNRMAGGRRLSRRNPNNMPGGQRNPVENQNGMNQRGDQKGSNAAWNEMGETWDRTQGAGQPGALKGEMWNPRRTVQRSGNFDGPNRGVAQNQNKGFDANRWSLPPQNIPTDPGQLAGAGGDGRSNNLGASEGAPNDFPPFPKGQSDNFQEPRDFGGPVGSHDANWRAGDVGDLQRNSGPRDGRVGGNYAWNSQNGYNRESAWQRNDEYRSDHFSDYDYN